jgi:hypothetical protein
MEFFTLRSHRRIRDLAVDGCITKAPARAETAGPSPVDRRKQGLKRSTGTDGTGVPLGLATTGANRHDSKLPAAILQAVNEQVGHLTPPECAVHPDSAYQGKAVAEILEDNGLTGEIAQKRTPAPSRQPAAGRSNAPIPERTNSWMNGFGKLRRCCERDSAVVTFYLYLAAAFVTVRALIRRARPVYRWDTRPTTRRLK